MQVLSRSFAMNKKSGQRVDNFTTIICKGAQHQYINNHSKAFFESYVVTKLL